MSNANSAQQALYAEIERQAKALAGEGYAPPQEASALKDIAAAFNLVSGGAITSF